MVGAQVARMGDTTSHSAPIIGGSSNVLVNYMPVARQTDQVEVHIFVVPPPEIHPLNLITTGNFITLVNYMPVAHVQSQVSCGAVVTFGSVDTIT